MTVRLGIDLLVDDPAPVAGKRIALLSHQASVTSDLRRTVLFHSLQSFVFNTIIVALTINLTAGLF